MTDQVRVAHITTVDMTHRFLLLGQLVRLREEGYDVTSISAPGPWVRDLEAEGIRHIPWPHVTRAWAPVADLRAFLSLLRILRRERFHLVHTHNPKPGILGRVAARLARTPCVVNTVHGFYAAPEDRPAKRLPILLLERIAARLSDLELYQSEEDLLWARRTGVVAPAKSVLLGNGADLSRFEPDAIPGERLLRLRAELGIPPGSLVVGSIGRLVEEKGFRDLFRAARLVRETMPEVRFLAVGEPDPEKGDAITDREMAAAREDVVFAGWRTDIPDLLALMDVFVLASWREGVPRSAIEAAAMARPMVLTDIRGCREVARHGVEALLVPPRSPRRLAAAIADLVRDQDLRRRLGAAARSRAVQRFDERAVIDRVIDGYRALLGRKGLLVSGVGTGLRVRRARPADAAALARLHRQALPDAFLPALGQRFLTRLYRALAEEHGAVAVVADDGRGVLGFAAGVPSVRRFYRRFYLRHGVAAFVAAIPALVRPSVLRRVWETARYPTNGRALPDAELLSIAVAPGSRSRGVGRALAQGVIDGLAQAGVREVKVVVAAENREANDFYARIGFRSRSQVMVHEGTRSNVWVMPCRSS